MRRFTLRVKKVNSCYQFYFHSKGDILIEFRQIKIKAVDISQSAYSKLEIPKFFFQNPFYPD